MTMTKRIFSVIMIAIMAFALFMPVTTFAAPNSNTGSGTGSLPYENKKETGATTEDGLIDPTQNEGKAINSIVGTMYKFATYISGLIFGVSVIMIVWAGFKYATSQGETKVTEQAKMQIITAGIGIGVALLAFIIVKVFAEIYNIA